MRYPKSGHATSTAVIWTALHAVGCIALWAHWCGAFVQPALHGPAWDAVGWQLACLTVAAVLTPLQLLDCLRRSEAGLGLHRTLSDGIVFSSLAGSGIFAVALARAFLSGEASPSPPHSLNAPALLHFFAAQVQGNNLSLQHLLCICCVATLGLAWAACASTGIDTNHTVSKGYNLKSHAAAGRRMAAAVSALLLLHCTVAGLFAHGTQPST